MADAAPRGDSVVSGNDPSKLSGLLVNKIMLRGRRLRAEVGDALQAAEASVTIDTIGEIAITLYDPDFELLRSGLLAKRGTVDLEDWRTEISVVETNAAEDGAGQVLIRCRSAAVGRLKRRRGPMVMEDASPSDFVEHECKEVGAKYVIQPSAKRRTVARDTAKSSDEAEGSGVRPSSWTTFERLGRELGYILFESGNTIYFGQPSWLRKRDGSPAVVTWQTGKATDCLGVPKFRDTLDGDDEATTVTFEVHRSRMREFLPGGRVQFKKFEPFDDEPFIVTGMAFPIVRDGILSVTAGMPTDPKPQPPAKRHPTLTSPATAGSRRLGDLLRHVGFSGDALAIATGVAVAESGGVEGGRAFVNAHALGDTALETAKWGPSVGVFQIRSLKHPLDWTGIDRDRVRSKLMGAVYNANLAYKISRGGRDWSAWSTYASGAYRAHMGAQDAEVRNFAGLPGTRGDGTGATGRKSAYDFVNLCLAQAGDAYVYGAEASTSDADPDAFDCSELIQWAAARVGCFMPDGSSNQIAHMRAKGTTISVAEGLRTRGAVLWVPGHVAVSLGGGRGTIEAANRQYGVRVFSSDRSFNWQAAGRIPGMRY